MNNHFKGLLDETFTGLKVILGTYTIHLVEGETSGVKRLVQRISQSMQSSTPFYNSAWVIHFVDEVPNKVFNQWFCKSISIGGAGKELKSMGSQMDKAYTIYEAMLEIGKQLSGKGISTQSHQPAQITQFIKGMASESLPLGEELLSACSDQEMTLPEFVAFLMDPPDVLLEKELVWPVEPDLMY